MPRSAPFHIHLLGLALGLILLVGGLLTGIGQHMSTRMMETVAEDLSVRIDRELRGSLLELVQPADMALRLLQHDQLTGAAELEQRLQRLPAIRAALDGSQALSSLYAGYPDGTFFFTRRLHDGALRERFNAPQQADYMVQSIADDDGVRRGLYLFFDGQLELLESREQADYPTRFDPRQRDWYRDAAADGGLLVTAPYAYFSDQQTGITLARRAPEHGVVLGADIRLHTLSEVLARQRVTPGSRLALVDSNGRLLAWDDPERPAALLDDKGIARLTAIAELARSPFRNRHDLIGQLLNGEPRDKPLKAMIGNQPWLFSAIALPMADAAPQHVLMAIPEHELLASAQRQRNAGLVLTLMALLIAIPFAWKLGHQIARPLNQLADDAEAIRRFNFEDSPLPSSRIREVATLGATMDDMRRTIRRFLELNTAVAGEPDFGHLLPRLLGETLSAIHARGGVLYLAREGQLVPVAALDADGRILSDGTLWGAEACDSHDRLGMLAKALDTLAPLLGQAIDSLQVRTSMLSDSELAALGLHSPAGISQAIAVPLANRQNELVGAMLLQLDTPADEDRLAFIRALSGLAAVTLEARALIAAQKALLDAMQRMIAGAIDAKSQHTGGHCARVPELARLIAEAACAAEHGPFADFQLDDNDWETLRMAAWLHDCGKITTPEYVVDKATKLQTLYDRIHEIRMRFEVLKCEAQLRCLQDIIDGADASQRHQQCRHELAQLDEEFAFVAHCNQGSESMAEADARRLQQIAERRWTRTLDDRLGLSHDDLQRKPKTAEATLPQSEPLLADRPEHLIERPPKERIEPDNPWGFRMAAPHWHQNLGELHNLCVRYGTLTEEERYLINFHIVQTEIMLRQLPFPPHLSQVPAVAAAHHERMDGSGYPKRLTGEQMQPMARMMAIADIFEALTAADRPYKTGKPLSEALSIMSRMARSGHIDPQLFSLFVRAGVYRQYASAFLPEQQIDAVDEEALLAGLEG